MWKWLIVLLTKSPFCCRYTLGTKPESIAILLCAIFPMWPIHSNDNRWVLVW